MASFHHLYDPEEEIWNIYLQFEFADLEKEAPPSLERVIQWFQQYPGFEGYPGFIVKEGVPLKNVTGKTIREISSNHGIEFVELSIKHAVNNFSNKQLLPGQSRLLAEAFMSEFESPLVFCNQCRGSGPHYWTSGFGGVTHPEFGHTIEYFLCCIDHKRIGFVFTLNDE
ncbi:hypothetical protein EI77_03935 [Prosthecobacter fusiformis]|uniref:Uncharacterized protein n=1 Tax=Prosthecobacter fusiformis TaxID=48464 RepID=A0A4R7RNM0_9BACT|nr:hypothetical protein [Prosthecobacter fusiformis]TDU66196.1 hypothetical protein EI77_03935 [Prosthecobacter fusiformis]